MRWRENTMTKTRKIKDENEKKRKCDNKNAKSRCRKSNIISWFYVFAFTSSYFLIGGTYFQPKIKSYFKLCNDLFFGFTFDVITCLFNCVLIGLFVKQQENTQNFVKLFSIKFYFISNTLLKRCYQHRPISPLLNFKSVKY